MSNLSKEDIKKLAAMTKLAIKDEELDSIKKQLEDVLSYAICIEQIARDVDVENNKNIDHDRKDVVIQASNAPILQQAPQVEDNYFVVPKIVEN